MNIRRPTVPEAYTKIVAYFSKPDARLSTREGEHGKECMYHGYDDEGVLVKCAIGCLIPDDVDVSEYEGQYVIAMLCNPQIARYLPNDCTFLVRAQAEHDDAPDVKTFLDTIHRPYEDWKERMKGVRA